MDEASLAVWAEGLRKSFQGQPAVEGLDLEIRRGEVFGLVGPDGAGKTTTFRLLCGILTPDSGRMQVAGYDVVENPEAVKRRIGYLSQAFSQYEDLTVWENLHFAADLYTIPEGEWQERGELLLRASGMVPFKSRLAGNLSGGMKQKLALSCTLLHTPEVVFLDEPTTGVDPVSRREFWSILYDLPTQNVTIVISTPYMDEAERCKRVAFLSHGRIFASGTPRELKASTGGDVLVLTTDRPREARDVLEGCEEVLQSVLFGDRVHALVEDAAVSAPRLRRALEEEGISVLTEARGEPGLEDVFVRLASRSDVALGGMGRG